MASDQRQGERLRAVRRLARRHRDNGADGSRGGFDREAVDGGADGFDDRDRADAARDGRHHDRARRVSATIYVTASKRVDVERVDITYNLGPMLHEAGMEWGDFTELNHPDLVAKLRRTIEEL